MTASKKKEIFGIITPVLTPFTADNKIDIPTLEKFIDWLTTRTVHGLFSMGGSGEWKYLQMDERKQIMDCVVKTSNKRVPVYTNVGANSLDETLELALYAQKAGVDAITVVTPDFIEGTQTALFNYFQAIDSQVDIPIFIYDPAGAGPFSPTPETMIRMLDKLKNIAAMKYRTVIGEDMAQMIMAVGDRMSIISGSEMVYLPDMALGTKGCVGGGCNLYPEIIWAIREQFEAGNHEGARKRQFEVIEHCRALGPVSWPCSGKIVLKALGIPFTEVTRARTLPYSREAVKQIQDYFVRLVPTLSRFSRKPPQALLQENQLK